MSSGWRPLTEQEAASWPKARLGGALLLMCVVAGLIALPLLVMGLAGIPRALESGPIFVWPPDFGSRENIARARETLGFASLGLWFSAAAGFVVLTLLRASFAPVAAAVGLVALFVSGEAITLFGHYLILAEVGGEAFVSYVLMSPELWLRWLGSAAVIAAAVGYLVGGIRPNAYYRRRVAAPEGEAR